MFSPVQQCASGSPNQFTDADAGDAQKNQRSRRSSKKGASTDKSDTDSESPYQILGLDEGATRDQITEAYRRLAKMYHPDRVSGLGPEFTEIAERKKALHEPRH
jgi:DnaJ-class molecular chaperone